MLFNPATGQLPSPAAMAAYAAIDPSYPEFLKHTFTAELKRNYQYQLMALLAGWFLGVAVLGGSVLMAYANHPKLAVGLITANFLGLATSILSRGATRRG